MAVISQITLGQAQRKFTKMLAKLILYIYDIGLEATLGEGYDDDNVGHMKGSLHYIRLAQDLNIFKDGIWLVLIRTLIWSFGLIRFMTIGTTNRWW